LNVCSIFEWPFTIADYCHLSRSFYVFKHGNYPYIFVVLFCSYAQKLTLLAYLSGANSSLLFI
jgi:hypothetical protein